jgi:fermentation-respiration switch protein FrsA (DUF1100 family)
MSEKILNQINEINPQTDQLPTSTQERNETKEINHQSNQSGKKLSLQTKIIIGVTIGIIIVAIIEIIVVLITKKDDKKDNNSSEDYYISDEICDSNNICYRLVNPIVEHYIFTLSENVERTHVRYKNRYGIEIAGDLYTPKNLDTSKTYRAIVVGPPFGGVKEQGPGVYCNQLAQRNFICLGFDPSFNGESSGQFRHVASSDIFAEDFSAGVDYLGSLKYVDRNNIGGIGICASGGFILGAASIDKRIKAVVTSAMYDIPSFGNDADDSTWQNTITNIAEQRLKDVDNGYPSYSPSYWVDREYNIGQIPPPPKENTDPNYNEWNTFYATKRGHHPRSTGGSTDSSQFSLANFPVTYHIDKISPRPILFITGDVAHSKQFSINTYNKAKEPKELYEVKGNCMHIDLYDDISKIPFDKIQTFFDENLK